MDEYKIKHLNMLMMIKSDPLKAIKKAKEVGYICLGLTFMEFLFLLAFFNQIPEIIRYALVALAAILSTLYVLQNESIRNIPLAVEFYNWGKIEKEVALNPKDASSLNKDR